MSRIATTKENNNNIILSSKVYDYVVEKIQNGSLSGKSKIHDRKIAKELQISHGPVREALGKLEENGWIIRIPQKGAYVNNFNSSETKKLYMLREIIEVGSVSFAIENITPEQIRELKTTSDAMAHAWENRDTQKYAQNDEKFHRLILLCAGNDRLYKIFDSLILQSKMAFPIDSFFQNLEAISHMLGDQKPLIQETLYHHHKIYEAIAVKNIPSAEKELRLHIRSSLKFVMGINKFREHFQQDVAYE